MMRHRYVAEFDATGREVRAGLLTILGSIRFNHSSTEITVAECPLFSAQYTSEKRTIRGLLVLSTTTTRLKSS